MKEELDAINWLDDKKCNSLDWDELRDKSFLIACVFVNFRSQTDPLLLRTLTDYTIGELLNKQLIIPGSEGTDWVVQNLQYISFSSLCYIINTTDTKEYPPLFKKELVRFSNTLKYDDFGKFIIETTELSQIYEETYTDLFNLFSSVKISDVVDYNNQITLSLGL